MTKESLEDFRLLARPVQDAEVEFIVSAKKDRAYSTASSSLSKNPMMLRGPVKIQNAPKKSSTFASCESRVTEQSGHERMKIASVWMMGSVIEQHNVL